MKRSILAIFSAISFAVMFAGCQTATEESLARAIMSRNPKEALDSFAKHRVRYYAYHPKQLQYDIVSLSHLVKSVIRYWGRGHVAVPKTKEYVKYLQNYKSRALINFKTGVITVETLSDARALKKSIVDTLLLPSNPADVHLFNTKNPKLGAMPYLYGEVKDNYHHNIRWPYSANRYANYLVAHNLRTKKIYINGKYQAMRYVTFNMVAQHNTIRAGKFKDIVNLYARKYNVKASLVYAIIRAESDFNQFAVSSVGAYGLMQLVPKTAGADAFKFVYNRRYTPSKEYLFNANNNINLGTAYLHILKTRYLSGIDNETSRDYCVISAYNTGSGNVLGVFSSNRYAAIHKINRLYSHTLYDILVKKLPYKQTRQYLQKVVRYQNYYTRW